MRRHVTPVRTVRFGPLKRTARFRGSDRVLDAVRSILRGWDVREVKARSTDKPLIRVARTRRGWRRVSPWVDRPSLVRPEITSRLIEALCGFHFELLDWYLSEHPTTLFVHGAAVEFGRKLVVFPALAKTGKSTLAVRLAMSGRRVFCDDVLPIDTRTARGVAIGIVPRIRQPLPKRSGAALRRFIHERRGHGVRNRLYVSLRPRELASYGETARIGAVVLLMRRRSGEAKMRRLDPAEAMERVVLQNFARAVPTPLILDTLARVVRGAACFRLRYVRTDDAVALLEETFGAARQRTVAPERVAGRPARSSGRR